MTLIDRLERILEKSWGADTATGDGAWSPENPSLNQCAVTALVVQDFFGGDLLRCPMDDGDSHYWNRLPCGTEVDLAEKQFKMIASKPLRDQKIVRDRKYVLSFPKTASRYLLLRDRVCKNLGINSGCEVCNDGK